MVLFWVGGNVCIENHVRTLGHTSAKGRWEQWLLQEFGGRGRGELSRIPAAGCAEPAMGLRCVRHRSWGAGADTGNFRQGMAALRRASVSWTKSPPLEPRRKPR